MQISLPRSISLSRIGIGPNIYLSAQDFALMLLLAAVLHAGVLMLLRAIPSAPAEKAQVRTINIRLGDEDSPEGYGASGGGGAAGALDIVNVPDVPVATVSNKPVAFDSGTKPFPKDAKIGAAFSLKEPASMAVKAEKKKPTEDMSTELPYVDPFSMERHVPEENVASAREQAQPKTYRVSNILSQPNAQRDVSIPGNKELPAIKNITPPASMVSMEGGERMSSSGVGGGTGQGSGSGVGAGMDGYGTGVGEASGSGMNTQTDAQRQAVMTRYEQMISRWIQRYQAYPTEARKQGITGKSTIRIRIDRAGRVLFTSLERSSGNVELDKAALDMARKASPVPPVPDDYPRDSLLEFLIPIAFQLR